MRQRETRKEEQRKKETSTPNITKTRTSPSPLMKDTHTDAKNRSTRKGNNQTKKIIPTKIQTHLNKLESHGYIKNGALAQSTRLYPIRRKNLQQSPLKVPVPE
jgi:hypothetical protein